MKTPRLVELKVGNVRYVGCLLFQSREFIVLLNNMGKGTDVGPLRPIRDEHIEPECDVLVLPRSPGMTVERLERKVRARQNANT